MSCIWPDQYLDHVQMAFSLEQISRDVILWMPKSSVNNPRRLPGSCFYFVMNYPVPTVPIQWIVQWATQSQCCIHLHFDKWRHHCGGALLPVFTHPLILHEVVISSPGVCVVGLLTWQHGCLFHWRWCGTGVTLSGCLPAIICQVGGLEGWVGVTSKLFASKSWFCTRRILIFSCFFLVTLILKRVSKLPRIKFDVLKKRDVKFPVQWGAPCLCHCRVRRRYSHGEW